MSRKFTIYQLIPRLFGNTTHVNLPNGSIDINGCGKLNAITAKALKSIQELGITHIWYTGLIEHATQTDYSAFGIRKDHAAVVKGKAGSPYAIKDYYDIDPDLATDVPNRMQEFEALVERTHKAGMKVLIDFVPNHVARQYASDAKPAGIADLGEKDNINHAFNPQNNFYYLPNQFFAGQFNLLKDEKVPYHEYPAKASGNDVFSAHPTVNDWYETVKLNYGVDYQGGHSKHFVPVPDTWTKMLDILLFWAGKQIDGFRCDMAEMVPVEFWSWVIPKVKEQFPHIIFIAEAYNPAVYRSYLDFGHFDYLYDKVGMYDTLRNITCGHESARHISVMWQRVNDILPKMLFFLENHDEQRIASRFFAGDARKALPAMIVTAALSTSVVMVYAGQELGEPAADAEGFSGDDGRTSIFDYWSVNSLRCWYNKGKCDGALLTKEQQELRDFYQQLLNISLQEKAIREGEMFDLMYINCNNPRFNPDRQFAYLRKAGDELLLICVNFADTAAEVAVNIPKHAFDYLALTDNVRISSRDLLTGKDDQQQMLSSECPFVVKLEKYSGKILKIKQVILTTKDH
jgi:glycosidase